MVILKCAEQGASLKSLVPEAQPPSLRGGLTPVVIVTAIMQRVGQWLESHIRVAHSPSQPPAPDFVCRAQTLTCGTRLARL